MLELFRDSYCSRVIRLKMVRVEDFPSMYRAGHCTLLCRQLHRSQCPRVQFLWVGYFDIQTFSGQLPSPTPTWNIDSMHSCAKLHFRVHAVQLWAHHIVHILYNDQLVFSSVSTISLFPQSPLPPVFHCLQYGMQVMESWAGPGNEAKSAPHSMQLCPPPQHTHQYSYFLCDVSKQRGKIHEVTNIVCTVNYIHKNNCNNKSAGFIYLMFCTKLEELETYVILCRFTLHLL